MALKKDVLIVVLRIVYTFLIVHFLVSLMPDKVKSKRGGARTGAGRKKGSSIYGESTRAIRVPESMLPDVKTMLERRKQQSVEVLANSIDYASISLPEQQPGKLKIPLFTAKVAAGFPSPADDYIEKTLDLNDLLVQKPAATFFVRAEGESMLGAGIHPNDILVVDRSLEPTVGKVVICALNGELTVKRLKSITQGVVLGAENPAYPDIIVQEYIDLVIWGVVTNVIHSL